MTYVSTPQNKNFGDRGHEIYNFGRPFLGHHHDRLSLSKSMEQDFLGKKMTWYGHALAQELLTGGFGI